MNRKKELSKEHQVIFPEGIEELLYFLETDDKIQHFARTLIQQYYRKIWVTNNSCYLLKKPKECPLVFYYFRVNNSSSEE